VEIFGTGDPHLREAEKGFASTAILARTPRVARSRRLLIAGVIPVPVGGVSIRRGAVRTVAVVTGCLD
jgi:hypothetical protein